MTRWPAVVRSMVARIETVCPACGALILAGDDVIAGPLPLPGHPRGAWVHRERCLGELYRAAGRAAPDVRARRETPADPGPSHAQTNRAGGPTCALCGRRIILGRDGAPVPDAEGMRHAVCPADRPGALPCGHVAVYRAGPLEGQCRACHRAARRRVGA